MEAPIQDIPTAPGSTQFHPRLGSSTSKRKVQRIRHSSQDLTSASEKDGEYQCMSSEEPRVKRQASKARLLGIFNKPRSTKASVAAAEQRLEGRTMISQEHDSSHIDDGALPAQAIEELLRVDSATSAKATKQQPSKSKRTKSFKRDASTSKSIPWDPPPLFQAYPQSVKHGNVQAPSVTADTILRCRSDRKRKQKKIHISNPKLNGDGSEEESQDQVEDSLQHLELAQKIYVIVTSGYFLQYAGEGSFDRLPEKIMPIGQESAAFASDAIPGKHWVLQVSHATDEDGNPKVEKWSLVKRLGFRGDTKRCNASNFLLILDGPEELDTWLGVVRREIEAWGGKRYQPDFAVHPVDSGATRTVQQKPSRRYLVKRDPNQFSNIRSNVVCDAAISGGTPASGTRKHSTATQDSVNSPSTSHMTASTDQNLLDRLRSSPRMSYISTGAKTHSTSRESSPVPSLTKLAFHPEDFTASFEQSELTRRKTFDTDQTVQSGFTTKSPLGPPSTNYSLPSFSKRYSGACFTPPLSSNSSNTSNPSRKAASPPIINEQRDSPQDTSAITPDDPTKQDPRSPDALPVNETAGSSLSVNECKPTVSGSNLRAPNADRTVPRRFSSLEYSRGISPVKKSPHTPSPHPPPSSALPALPNLSNNNPSSSTRNLRRPVSMQIHPSLLPSSSANSQSSLPPIPSPPNNVESQLSPPSRDPPPPPSLLANPSANHPEQQLPPPNKVFNRRSMPHLSSPPSDPPNCPLPTPPVPRLPPIKLSTGSLRRSVERPLKSDFGTRRVGLSEDDEG